MIHLDKHETEVTSVIIYLYARDCMFRYEDLNYSWSVSDMRLMWLTRRLFIGYETCNYSQ